MLNLSLIFGTVPAGQEFPGTPQALGDFLAQYFWITGGENFIAINFGPDEPDADNRDAPWFKTDNDGVPIGWFSWNGAAWQQMPTNVPNGTTAQRPSDPGEGDLFFDSDIEVLIIYHSAAWITAAGSPGDLKHVQATTIEQALTKNPGWSQATEATYSGRVLGAAGDGTSLTPRAYGDVDGAEEITLTINQIPEHTHTIGGLADQAWAANLNVSNPAGNLAHYGSSSTGSTPAIGTGGLAHDNMMPVIFVWLLVKD